jgi:hypothetical protein
VAVALAVAAPWLFIVITRHGMAVLTDVPSNGPDLVTAALALLAGRATGLPFADPLALFGVALALLAVIQRRFLLPIWLLAATVVSYQYGMVPFGLLIGAFAVDLATALRVRSVSRSRVPGVVAAVLAAAFVFEGAVAAGTVLNPGAPVHALDAARREAMSWVADVLPTDARVALITDGEWSGDPDSEWFPQLTHRVSVATVQGSEWLGTDAFETQVQAHRALQNCAGEESDEVGCVTDWLVQWPADYVYLPKGPLHGRNGPPDCCALLREALVGSPFFVLAYDDAGATILRVDLP